MNAIVSCALAMLPAWALAHEGHGQAGSHWHATDPWGFVALGVAVAAIAWHQRRK